MALDGFVSLHESSGSVSGGRGRCVDAAGGGGGGGAFCVCKGGGRVCVELVSEGGLLKFVAAAAGLRLNTNLLLGTFGTRNASLERSSSFS